MIPIREWMNSPVKTIHKEKSIREAARYMAKERIGALVVIDKEPDVAIGIITERDILDKVVARNRDPDKIKVFQVMSKNIVALPPDTPIIKATTLMSKHGCRRILVVENGKVVGILTSRDMIDLISVE